MQKIGMKYEGCQRQQVKKWDKFEDIAIYGILRSEYQN
jgi:ribosomal-protein-alanine N-acetyltransferase